MRITALTRTGSRGREPGAVPTEPPVPGTAGNRNPHNRRSDPVPDLGNRLGTEGHVAGSRSPQPEGRERGTAPACLSGTTGRVVPRRHVGDCDDETCAGCLPCTETHCLTCHREHAQTTCPRCVGVARANLAAVRQLMTQLPTEAREGRHAYHIHEGVPGGDAVVLLTPAAGQRGRVGQTRRPTPEPGDPTPPLDTLVFWEELWRGQAQRPTGLHPTLDRVGDYLDTELHLIAGSRIFPHLSRDLARTLRQVENVLHDGVRPEVTRVPCWECGARLEKVYGDQARHDHWACSRCHEVYDQGRYERAKYDHLASQGAERYVPVSDAIAATGRPEQTVRGWMRTGAVGTQRDPGSGRLLVWWPDVRARHVEAESRKRS